MMTKEVAVDSIMVDDMSYSTSVGMDMPIDSEMMINEANESSGLSTHVILYIVIGVCAVLGLVLGIIFGRKAAYK